MENRKNGMALKVLVESRFPRYCTHCGGTIPVGHKFIELIWDSQQRQAVFCLDCAKGEAIRNKAMQKRAIRKVKRIIKRGEAVDSLALADFNSFCVKWNALVGIRPQSTALESEVLVEALN